MLDPWPLDIIPSYPRVGNGRSFTKVFSALVMSERDFLAQASIVLFELILLVAGFRATCVVNIEGRSYDFQLLSQRAENIWSILLIEGLKYVA